jgi:hypothetical protein
VLWRLGLHGWEGHGALDHFLPRGKVAVELNGIDACWYPCSLLDTQGGEETSKLKTRLEKGKWAILTLPTVAPPNKNLHDEVFN